MMVAALLIGAICGLIFLIGRLRPLLAVQLSVFLAMCSTHYWVIELPGSLPNITIQRALIITLFLILRSSWAFGKQRLAGVVNQGFRWVVVAITFSLIGGVNWEDGPKEWLSFLVESWFFFNLSLRAASTAREARAVLRAAVLGLVVVAGFTFLERYWGFNPVDRYLPGYERSQGTYGDVLATFPHRILLGTAMAMAVPLLCAAEILPWTKGQGGPRRLVQLVMIGACASACYFSGSRGPWLGLVIGMGVLGWLGIRRQRVMLFVVAICVAIVLVIRPGVAETLSSRYQSTFDTDSFKAGTYKYRWELWRVAWTRITDSPWRLVFGYGPTGSRRIDQEWDAHYTAQARTVQIWSWDNEYALILLNYGLMGLVLTVALYFVVMRQLLRRCRASKGSSREGLAAIVGSLTILLFMKSNVLIFAPQLNMLLWLLTACGLRWDDWGKAPTPAVAHAEPSAASAPLEAGPVNL